MIRRVLLIFYFIKEKLNQNKDFVFEYNISYFQQLKYTIHLIDSLIDCI